jgi:hypothetical protein
MVLLAALALSLLWLPWWWREKKKKAVAHHL